MSKVVRFLLNLLVTAFVAAAATFGLRQVWTGPMGGADMTLHGWIALGLALFGTCGMGNDPAYYQKVIDRVKTWIPEDNEYMDAFLCQGKMPIQVRRRYEEMAKSGQNTEQIQAMIRNFDRAMLHPDRADEAAAADFAVQVWKRIGS